MRNNIHHITKDNRKAMYNFRSNDRDEQLNIVLAITLYMGDPILRNAAGSTGVKKGFRVGGNGLEVGYCAIMMSSCYIQRKHFYYNTLLASILCSK